jgi:hypothetical protein
MSIINGTTGQVSCMEQFNNTCGQVNLKSNNTIIVGGCFIMAGQIICNNIVKWDNSTYENTWIPLIDHNNNVGINGTISAIAVSNNLIYIAGSFTQVGQIVTNNIIIWNDDLRTWTALQNGINGKINVLKTDPNSGRIYAGGKFSVNALDSLGAPVIANNIAYWFEDNWYSLDNISEVTPLSNNLANPDDEIFTICIDPIKQYIYVGGKFTINGAKNIATWDSTAVINQWSSLNDGTDDTVFTIAITAGDNIIVGGAFLNVFNFNNPVPCKYIANFNTITRNWSKIDYNEGIVKSIVIDHQNNMYVASIRNLKQIVKPLSNRINRVPSFTNYSYVSLYKNITGNLTRYGHGNCHGYCLGRCEGEITNMLLIPSGLTSMEVNANVLFIGGSFLDLESESGLGNITCSNIAILINGSNWNSLPNQIYITSLEVNLPTSISESGNDNMIGVEQSPILSIMEGIKRANNNTVLIISNNALNNTCLQANFSRSSKPIVVPVYYSLYNKTITSTDANSNVVSVLINNRNKNLFYVFDNILNTSPEDNLNHIKNSENIYEKLVTYLYGQYDAVTGCPIFSDVSFITSILSSKYKKPEVYIFTRSNNLSQQLIKTLDIPIGNQLDYTIKQNTDTIYQLYTLTVNVKASENTLTGYNLKKLFIQPMSLRIIDYHDKSSKKLIVNCSVKQLSFDNLEDTIFTVHHKNFKRKQMLEYLHNSLYYDKIYIKYKNSTFELNMESHEKKINDKDNIFKIIEKRKNYRMLDGNKQVYIYPLHDTSKYIQLTINVSNDEYIVLEFYADIKTDGRSIVLISSKIITSDIIPEKSRFRGALYNEIDCIQLKNVYDTQEYFIRNYATGQPINIESKFYANRLRAQTIKNWKVS